MREWRERWAFALATKLLHPRPKAMGVEQQSAEFETGRNFRFLALTLWACNGATGGQQVPGTCRWAAPVAGRWNEIWEGMLTCTSSTPFVPQGRATRVGKSNRSCLSADGFGLRKG